ncbi:SDR family oxidoreductase [Shimia abyssi]|uniref:NAD(P)-dependent dehydrogenase (Short-subunit alcohol dehydrogenase family) n=1 Tax=Shimia abyssi TaxID=1662395 RepID=A0A2P8FIP7_9RHOB|nr:SDR family NAD(P)-dependent oxidoreductase [Shimia abyssi]PSL21590.1 NAD(P)-dependent dehydrogenase (short-subunit alcohol dehydrogenase family) [Shimia abyssi]
MKLDTTCAIITGGASGLGAATARHFAEQGAKVALLDLNQDAGTALAADLGGTFHKTDVTDEASVSAAITAAASSMGGLTAAVNCAGIAPAATTIGKNGPHPLDMFQKTIDINLVGTFNVARLAADAMSHNTPEPDGARGVIINTASIAAMDGQRGQAAYAASKGGIVGLSLPMARDLARAGIRVMAIAPGIFLTPMLQGLPQEVQDQLAQSATCPKRLGDPSEYARLAGFIVENGYLNGEVIRIDGALRMQ